MSGFPERARVVIVGLGGIVGASVAHHLIARGWDDIVGTDKSGIPTDTGSTAHASDFCYATSHDNLTCWTTLYSIDFYEKIGHYARIGGIEVARVGDDGRMDEIRRKVDSARAFGTRARLIDPADIKAKFPLLEESMVQGGLWDPDAGLVIPRSQTVAGKLVDQAVADGKLQAFANTSAKSLVIENGRVKGVATDRGTIHADYVVVCAGLWGRLIAEMAGEDLPVMPVDHPLTFFGPYTEFAGTGKRSAGRCCATRATRPICATRAIPRPPKADRSSGATTKSTSRASCIPATSWRRNRRGCRPPSATSTWSRSSRRWSGQSS
ncbi:hypothetical protein MesoLjLc_76900 [Mesorhizobium sp. L-8-10]|nr:hypothetical protein MesoLjLc_76900 [Mesorhizobium sp. L-8-10]